MTLLQHAYGLDAAVTLSFAIAVLFQRHILRFEGSAPQQSGNQTKPLSQLIGCIWLGMAIMLAIGIFRPVLMAPILILQLLYKGVWLAVFLLQLMQHQTPSRGSWPMGIVFGLYCLAYPWVIPWAEFWK